MSLKRIHILLPLLAVLLAAFALPGTVALAWSTSCGTTYSVQWGDTLGSIANKCGTTIAALRQANPGLGYWLYAGQTISLPAYTTNSGHGNYVSGANAHTTRTYVVQWGDTLRKIADRVNVNLADLTAANPQIWNPNWIFAGQVINLPAPAQYYTVQPGDTLKIIAARFSTSVYGLQTLNPQIWNPDLIYVGQVVRLW